MIFLNREGDFSKEVKYEERIDRANLGRVFLEELEEWEILNNWMLIYYFGSSILFKSKDNFKFTFFFFLFKKENFGFEWGQIWAKKTLKVRKTLGKFWFP